MACFKDIPGIALRGPRKTTKDFIQGRKRTGTFEIGDKMPVHCDVPCESG